VRIFDGNVLTGLRTVAIVDGQISTGFVESAINHVSKRMLKKQQMGWSRRGAHLLLQEKTRVLDEERENTLPDLVSGFPSSRTNQRKRLDPRESWPAKVAAVSLSIGGRRAGLTGAQRAPNAIGIIFSGNGSDGAKGIQAVKQAGGITFAQDESSALFYGNASAAPSEQDA
jgi:CheB methylesterase